MTHRYLVSIRKPVFTLLDIEPHAKWINQDRYLSVLLDTSRDLDSILPWWTSHEALSLSSNSSKDSGRLVAWQGPPERILWATGLLKGWINTYVGRDGITPYSIFRLYSPWSTLHRPRVGYRLLPPETRPVRPQSSPDQSYRCSDWSPRCKARSIRRKSIYPWSRVSGNVTASSNLSHSKVPLHIRPEGAKSDSHFVTWHWR